MIFAMILLLYEKQKISLTIAIARNCSRAGSCPTAWGVRPSLLAIAGLLSPGIGYLSCLAHVVQLALQQHTIAMRGIGYVDFDGECRSIFAPDD